MESQNFKIVIPCSKTYEFVHVSDIVRCEGLQNYTRIYLRNGKCIISSCNIGIYKKVLAGYDFFHCHKSHLVNKQLIHRYHKLGSVEMVDGSNVPVSRRKKESFYTEIIDKFNMVSLKAS